MKRYGSNFIRVSSAQPSSVLVLPVLFVPEAEMNPEVLLYYLVCTYEIHTTEYTIRGPADVVRGIRLRMSCTVHPVMSVHDDDNW